MPHILSGIHTLDQHLQTWLDDIDQYRPSQCPHCGRSGLWLGILVIPIIDSGFIRSLNQPSAKDFILSLWVIGFSKFAHCFSHRFSFKF